MTGMVLHAGHGQVLPPAPPSTRPPSAPLARAMALALRAVAADDKTAERLTPALAMEVREEAERRLALAEAALAAPPPASAIRDWTLHVIALIGHPSDADSIRAKCDAMASALSALPRRSITIRSAERVAAAAGRFFPALSEILALLHPEADELRREVERLRAVVRLGAPARESGDAAAEDWSPDAVRARVEAIARGPLDRWTVVQIGTLARAIAHHAPDMLAEVEARLKAVVAVAQEAERAAAERAFAAGLAPDAAARARAADPDTPEDELRALATSARPGAALARMRLQAVEGRRTQRGGAV